MIIFNILWLGYDGDANDEPNIWNAEARFLGMELFFCAFFTFEIAVRQKTIGRTVQRSHGVGACLQAPFSYGFSH